jgi:hypothetical protein
MVFKEKLLGAHLKLFDLSILIVDFNYFQMAFNQIKAQKI